MALIHRRLYGKKTFWGFVRMKGGGWRVGFGFGFFEFSTKACSGIWLPKREL